MPSSQPRDPPASPTPALATSPSRTGGISLGRTSTGSGDTITFHCQPGHRLFGTARRTCLANGEWSGRTAACDPEDSLCPWPGIPLGGHRQGHVFEPGRAVRFTCLRELVLRGSPRRVCQNSGQWSGEEPRCEGRYAYDNVSSVAKHLDMSEEITAHAQTGANIYFVVHASGSVGAENVKMSGEFIIAVMEQATRVSDKVWFTVVAFASSAQLVSVLTQSPAEVGAAWEQFQNTSSFTQRGTNVGAALGQVLSLIQTAPPRTSARKHIVVLITSGRHNVGLDPSQGVSTNPGGHPQPGPEPGYLRSGGSGMPTRSRWSESPRRSQEPKDPSTCRTTETWGPSPSWCGAWAKDSAVGCGAWGRAGFIGRVFPWGAGGGEAVALAGVSEVQRQESTQ
ncbi:unnamed protein product [Eretmochelys imbricata]